MTSALPQEETKIQIMMLEMMHPLTTWTAIFFGDRPIQQWSSRKDKDLVRHGYE